MRIRVGSFGRPHGLRGEILFRVLDESLWQPTSGQDIFVGNETLILRSVRRHQKDYLVQFPGINIRAAVKRLVNRQVSADIEGLPEHTFLIKDLVGAKVTTVDGRHLGTLTQVISSPAQDLFQVGDGKKQILIPALKSIVRRFDAQKRELMVELPDGLEECTAWYGKTD